MVKLLKVIEASSDQGNTDLTEAEEILTEALEPSVCNLSNQVGAGIDIQTGICVIAIGGDEIAAATTAAAEEEEFSPESLGEVRVFGYANNVDVNGNFAYVAAGSAGLQIFNVTNRNNPIRIRSFGLEGTNSNANDIKVIGDQVVLAIGAAGIEIIDVKDPQNTNPERIGSIDPSKGENTEDQGKAQDLVVRGNLVYVADGLQGLQIIDISDLKKPKLMGSLPITANGETDPIAVIGVDVDQGTNRAVLALGEAGVQVVNISDPEKPQKDGDIISLSEESDAQDIVTALSGNSIALVADSEDGFSSVDYGAADNADRGVVKKLSQNQGGLPSDISLLDDFAFSANTRDLMIPIIDVSNPADPENDETIDFENDMQATGIAADKQYVYLTSAVKFEKNGKGAAGVEDNARLFIGQYRLMVDTDKNSPSVSITTPASEAKVSPNEFMLMTVDASDDIGIKEVVFQVGDNIEFTDTVAPYEFWFLLPETEQMLTLKATARDFGAEDNEATAEIEIEIVIDEPTPTGSC